MELRSASPVPYVGRFAPSPTGPLHAGSLLTAAASFLHARQAGGQWLVRIEDIDPPREAPGAADDILKCLETFALHWDGRVLNQSSRLEVYEAAVHVLLEKGLAFRCTCSRGTLRAHAAGRRGAAAGYPGTCRSAPPPVGPSAVRLRVDSEWAPFEDGIQGRVEASRPAGFGDYVIRRRDGLPAYHLAVVIDDAFQGVTTIVRGADLLDCVPAQRHLQHALGLPAAEYFHVPVLTAPTGDKLSKQTGAKPLNLRRCSELARRTLALLGAEVPAELHGAPPALLWEWAIGHWRIDAAEGVRSLPADDGDGEPDESRGEARRRSRATEDLDVAHAEANPPLPVDL